MENKKLLELNDDDLNAVSGGADANYYRSCTDFICFHCGYQRTDPGEMYHVCADTGFSAAHRCDNCELLQRCDHGLAFMEKDNEIMGNGG